MAGLGFRAKIVFGGWNKGLMSTRRTVLYWSFCRASTWGVFTNDRTKKKTKLHKQKTLINKKIYVCGKIHTIADNNSLRMCIIISV